MILLILTDGIINDMQKTIDEIVRGSSLPLSIIIVGVGSADFSSMDILDADDEPLYSKKYKKYMASDIVQFVPFSEFKNDPRLLAKETLEEIPAQFLGFMEKNGIVPKQVHEAEKHKIKSQLTKQKSMKSNNEKKEAPDFFKDLKEEFLNQVTDMGFNAEVFESFIEEKGLSELSVDLALADYENSKFKNPLFKKAEEQKFEYMELPYDSMAPKGQPVSMFNSAQDQSIMSSLEEKLCKVCLDRQIDTVCVPCGHRCLCLECG